MTVLIESKRDTYLQELVNQVSANSVVASLSEKAVADLAGKTLPDKNDEDWRFTDLSELTSLSWSLPSSVALDQLSIEQFKLPETQQSRIVFVNGVYGENLSDISGLPDGVYVGNLENLDTAKKNKIVEYLNSYYGEKDVFGVLNTAGIQDIAVIWVEKDVIVEQPIHLLYLTVPETKAIFSQPRNLVIVERNAKLELLECYGAIAENCSDISQNRNYFNNVVTEVFLGENACLQHNRIQRESGDAIQISNTTVEQAENSNYSILEISLGAKLARHNLAIYQTGAQTTTNLNGLSLVANKQVTDIHSLVALNYPHGNVHQVYKTIIDGQAQGVFNGKILVPQKAQLTNASQINRNLLLSPQGRVNTKPELQITADNVKCTHGATVSQLETDEVFYLRSRGLSELDARHLLLEAFALEILDQLSIDSLRKRLIQCVACRNN